MRIPCPSRGNEYNNRMSAPDPVPFDSHQFVKRMTEAGMPLAQAEALAGEQGAMIDTNFATKRDTGELRHRLTSMAQDIDVLRQDTGELKLRLANVEQDTGELKHRLANVEREVEELKHRLANVEREVEELKHRLTNVERAVEELQRRLANVERDVGELKTGLAVVRAELGMVKWMVSGIGAGMLLLLVQTFWPI